MHAGEHGVGTHLYGGLLVHTNPGLQLFIMLLHVPLGILGEGPGEEPPPGLLGEGSGFDLFCFELITIRTIPAINNTPNTPNKIFQSFLIY